jgi:hypothetical protein
MNNSETKLHPAMIFLLILFSVAIAHFLISAFEHAVNLYDNGGFFVYMFVCYLESALGLAFDLPALVLFVYPCCLYLKRRNTVRPFVWITSIILIGILYWLLLGCLFKKASGLFLLPDCIGILVGSISIWFFLNKINLSTSRWIIVILGFVTIGVLMFPLSLLHHDDPNLYIEKVKLKN